MPEPTAATRVAPERAPTMRAESAVVRDTPMARISRSDGMVSPTRRLRIVMSDGRTSPITVPMTNTTPGVA